MQLTPYGSARLPPFLGFLGKNRRKSLSHFLRKSGEMDRNDMKFIEFLHCFFLLMVRSLNNVEDGSNWTKLPIRRSACPHWIGFIIVYIRLTNQNNTYEFKFHSRYIYCTYILKVFLNKPDISILNGSNHGWPTLY